MVWKHTKDFRRKGIAWRQFECNGSVAMLGHVESEALNNPHKWWAAYGKASPAGMQMQTKGFMSQGEAKAALDNIMKNKPNG